MHIKTILLVMGTRPEAIKMCPLIKELRERKGFSIAVCVTGQHREMLSQVLEAFQIAPEFDLRIMREGQTLFDVTSRVMNGLNGVLDQVRPDLVLVHGDTTTAFAAALSSFYKQIPVGHVEAGLRTWNLSSPYPEEFNRQAVGVMASLHFAPTAAAKANLIREGKEEKTIFVTGNTAIDALRTTVREDYRHPLLDWAGDSRLILITAHRRENLGEPMEHMFCAIRRVLLEHPDVKAVYPIHMNPKIRRTAEEILGGCFSLRMTEPMDVVDFHNILARCCLVLTDSGGIQEEAPSLGKPVLVLRDTTERPEGLAAGTLRLAGTEEEGIYRSFTRLLEDGREYEKMSRASNPYGDGYACPRIADILEGYGR